MKLQALFLNCTLKRTPQVSNTRALIDKVIGFMEPLGVEAEVVRISDYNVLAGVSTDEGDGDQWPQIYDKVKVADILVIGTPIWFGVRSSIAQMVLERLDGSYGEGDPGPGPSYIAAGGDKHMYTNKTARFMAHNVVYMARLLKENPIPTNIRQLTEDAGNDSNDSCPVRHGDS